jgi:GNAT superfamily N-acetyltransferase/catechol 2,3-dioxygenase-like lactoylglutathione lyase family enzyme
MIFKNTVPILYSSDIQRSLTYYIEILGFERRWDWGNPPSFGGVSKDSVEIFFCERGQGNPGTWLSVLVDDVDDLYEKLKSRGAKILTAPESMEWGIREMLVEDPDGHRIRFGQNAHLSDRQKSAAELPSTIRIIERSPTVDEYRNLLFAVGWSTSIETGIVERVLEAAVFTVVAENTVNGEGIGCALLLGDHASFYYVKDVMVHPVWQGKRIGTALMQALSRWLETKAAGNIMVGLITGENLAPFYRQFGFTPVFGMHRKIQRNEKNM